MKSQNETKPPEIPPNELAIDIGQPRSTTILLTLIVVLFIAARIWRLTASCLWFDEIFSVHAARHSWADMMRFVSADIIHPPLFYALLKIWISVGGDSLLWLRLFPALMSITAILPFLLLGRELRRGPGEMNLALLLMSVNGYLIKYGQEVRMYSLLLFFSLCALWLFVRFMRLERSSKKLLAALFIANLLLVYTHYAGWIIVVFQAIALLIWSRRKLSLFLVSATGLVLAYLPWIYKVTLAANTGRGFAQNIGWVTRPHLEEIAQYFTLLNKPFLFNRSSIDALFDPSSAALVLCLFGLPLMALSWRLFQPKPVDDRGRVEALRSLFLFSFAPALVVFLLSWILSYSIWGTRHLIITAGPYAILAAIALKQLHPYWIRITVFLISGCWFLLAGSLFLLLRPPAFIWCAWEPIAHEMMLIESDSSEAVEVYAYEDLVAYHLWFALDTARNARFKVAVIKGVPDIPEDPAYFLPRGFSDIKAKDCAAPKGKNIWVAFRAAQWDETRPPLNVLEASGYQVGRVLSLKAQGEQAFLVKLWRN